MQWSLLNPFSDKFLQTTPDKAQTRETLAKLNSFGVGEDTLDLSKLVRGYGAGSPIYPYEQNNIIFDTVFTTKRQRINYYRSMAKYAFVKKMLTIISDECCSKRADGTVASFDIDPAYRSKFTETEYNSLKAQFDYIINAVFKKKMLWKYFNRWLVDGEIFLEICLNDEKDCVSGLKQLPPYCTLCVYDEGILTGFVQDPSLINAEYDRNNIKTFTRNQIAYANYGLYGNNLNDVRGHLEAAIKPINQLRAMEDAQAVYFMVRAPEKRIWKIYGGGLPVPKQQEYLQQCIAQYRRDLNLDPHTGLVNGAQNTQALSQDIWVLQDRNGNSTQVETFQSGQQFNGMHEAIEGYKEMVADAMEIPATRWKLDAGSAQYVQGVEGLSIDESSFQQRCARWAEDFADVIKQVFIVQLQVAGFKDKYLDSDAYSIGLIPSTDTRRFREIAMAEKAVGVLGGLTTMMPTRTNIKADSDEAPPLLSKQYVFQKYLGWSSEDMLLNDAMLKRETAEIKKEQDAIKDEGGDSESDEGDMEF